MGTAAPARRQRSVALVVAVAVAAGVFSVRGPAPGAAAVGPPLTTVDVTELVSRCVTYARRLRRQKPLTIAVVDAEGNSLGVFAMTGSTGCRAIALAKASTATYFSSDFGSFTTRTAEYIIQDHFPPGVRYAPGGPLYGVQFSSVGTSDVNPIYFPAPLDVPPGTLCDGLPEVAQARVRGDLGGVALYKDGRRVGGLGIDDGGRNRVTIPVAAITSPARRYRLTFRRLERGRRLERIVMAAARGFLPSVGKRARRINIDGFALPFAKPTGLRRRAATPIVLGVDGDFDPDYPLRDAAPIPSRFTPLTVLPPAGASAAAAAFIGQAPVAFAPKAGTDGLLSEADVRRILWQGAQRANATRAAIRRPIGLAMQCWISVVDTKGEVLGVLRTSDATLFSYDVSVQKARTALLFSEPGAAWSTRAVGQFSQAFYPAGRQNGQTGPLYQLQDGITVGLLTGGFATPDARIAAGITIFPGGVPLYRDGVLVGAVGVSGDGVDQDDITADAASGGFRAPPRIRCDQLTKTRLASSLRRALGRIEALAPTPPLGDPIADAGLAFFGVRLARVRARLARTALTVSPPYVKFPRHPGPVTIRRR